MKRKDFLQLSGTVALGASFSPFISCDTKPSFKNWAGNITFSTTNVNAPTSIQELQALVGKLKSLKAQGTCHCFNRIADSKEALVAMKQMNKVISFDKEKATVKVEAGIKYGELAPFLHENGFALHNLASLPHISVAGSIATATHGSGVSNGNLATAVIALEFVDASGNIVSLYKEKDGDLFNGAVVSLGSIGVVTNVTLQLHPTFLVKQFVFENLPVDQLNEHFESILSAGYSVSLFTDWQTDSINEVWIKCKADEQDPVAKGHDFYGAKAATKNMHPIASSSAENCTEQIGVPGPWFERLPHFKMGFTPSSGVELQSEFFVPFEHAIEAMKEVAKLRKEIGPHLMITEIRTIAADDFWMSTAYKRKSVAIHFTWKQETDAVMALLPKIEKALEPFAPRPHWGKLFTIPLEVLETRYERMQDFRNLAHKYDPTGKFKNDFLQTNIFGKA